jgi:thiol reductant ABC exporter CydD subunit
VASPPEPEQGRSGGRGVQKRLAILAPAARLHLVATVVLGVAATALVVAQASLMAHVVTRVFLGGATLSDVSASLWWLAGLSVGRGLVAAGFEAGGRYGAARVMARLRELLVRHLLLVRPAALADASAGELAATSVQGVDALEAYLARYLPQAVLSVLTPLAILLWVLPRNWESAAILAVTVPLMPVFMILVGKLAAQRSRARWRTLATLSARFLDLVSGLETLRAFGRAHAGAHVLRQSGDAYRRETMATLRVGFLSALVLELLATLGTALVAVTVGVQLAAGSLSLEPGLVILILAPELYAPLRELGAQYHSRADGLAAAERILEVLDVPDRVVLLPPTVEAPDPAIDAVVLSELRFAYPGRPAPVLEGATLELEPGVVTGLVGPSGCGKTTLATLLLRLAEPQAGSLMCGGVDLRHVDPRAWRARVAWVPQHATLFAGTVADNVRLARPQASDDEVVRALHAGGADDLVAGLPEGLEERIGDGGRRLSAGQARRIALARAFLRDAALVVLDEPTAHLDPASAVEVGAAIERLCAGRTALVITHRGALASRCDRLLELSDGRILLRAERAAEVAA